MKKILFFFLAFTSLMPVLGHEIYSQKANMQEYPNHTQIGYKGFIEVDYVMPTGEYEHLNRWEVNTVHGYQFNGQAFLGFGVGVRTYSYTNDSYISIPLFLNCRYLFTQNKISPFIDVKLGGMLKDVQGGFIKPSLGLRIAKLDNIGINIAVGYDFEFIHQEYGKRYFSRDINITPQGMNIKFGLDF